MPEREDFEYSPTQAQSGQIPRSFFQSEEEYQRYLQQLQRSQDQITQILDPYGPDAQQRGYNTYEEAQRVNDAKRTRRLVTHGVLPTLGFIGGSAALGALGGGGAAGAAGTGASEFAVGSSPMAMQAPSVGSMVAGGSGAGMGAGAGAAGILGNLSARDIAALAMSGAGTLGGALSNRGQNTNPTTATSDPQMKELLDLMMGRVRKSEPLYDSVLAMANGLLPTQYQKGGGGMG